MLGFPIRTPPDHSSVANSPGLIAGSYVLHRLLMPRHPPCALHSLSHKHSTKTTTTHRSNPLPTKQEASRHSGQSSTTKTNPEHTNTPHNQSRSPSNSPRVRHVCIWVDNRDNPMVSGSSRRCSRPLSSSQCARPPTRTSPHHMDKLPKGAQRRSPATTHPRRDDPVGLWLV